MAGTALPHEAEEFLLWLGVEPVSYTHLTLPTNTVTWGGGGGGGGV